MPSPSVSDDGALTPSTALMEHLLIETAGASLVWNDLQQRLLLKDGVAPSMPECFSDFSRADAALVRASVSQ